MAEEHERVHARREERLQPVRPDVERGGIVVVAAQPQVQVRAGPMQVRRGRIVGGLRRAQDRAGFGQGGERLVNEPGRVLELNGQGQVARPRRQESRQSRVIALTPRGRGRGRNRVAPRTPDTDR